MSPMDTLTTWTADHYAALILIVAALVVLGIYAAVRGEQEVDATFARVSADELMSAEAYDDMPDMDVMAVRESLSRDTLAYALEMRSLDERRRMHNLGGAS